VHWQSTFKRAHSRLDSLLNGSKSPDPGLNPEDLDTIWFCAVKEVQQEVEQERFGSVPGQLCLDGFKFRGQLLHLHEPGL
jgi:hypothetical protein